MLKTNLVFYICNENLNQKYFRVAKKVDKEMERIFNLRLKALNVNKGQFENFIRFNILILQTSISEVFEKHVSMFKTLEEYEDNVKIRLAIQYEYFLEKIQTFTENKVTFNDKEYLKLFKGVLNKETFTTLEKYVVNQYSPSDKIKFRNFVMYCFIIKGLFSMERRNVLLTQYFNESHSNSRIPELFIIFYQELFGPITNFTDRQVLVNFKLEEYLQQDWMDSILRHTRDDYEIDILKDSFQ